MQRSKYAKVAVMASVLATTAALALTPGTAWAVTSECYIGYNDQACQTGVVAANSTYHHIHLRVRAFSAPSVTCRVYDVSNWNQVGSPLRATVRTQWSRIPGLYGRYTAICVKEGAKGTGDGYLTNQLSP